MNSTELKNILDSLEINKRTKIEYIPPSKINDLLNEIVTELSDDFETNSWSVDFWIPFKYNEKEFTFSGSWYYGNYSIRRES